MKTAADGKEFKIEYDIPESEFRRALTGLTENAVTSGTLENTFEVEGKSGLIYTYTEASLKVLRAETKGEHAARVAKKNEVAEQSENTADVLKLWKILRQKQETLKAMMTSENIVEQRKSSAQMGEIFKLVAAINFEKQKAIVAA